MLEPVDVLEALLFASDAPVEAERIQEVLDLDSAAEARELIGALRQRLEGRALQVVEAGGGFRLVTRPELAPWLVKLQRSKTRSRLSRPALETLAIVAYHQPVSRPEVDAIRGVNSEGVLENLLDRRMVKLAGRKDSPGRPFLYETTRDFLVAFGLRDLGDLPKVEGELQMPEPAPSAPESAGAAETADPREADEMTEVAETSGLPVRPEPPATAEATDTEPADTEPAVPMPPAVAEAEEAERMATEPPRTGEGRAAADPPQQDPGAGRADVAPRS